VVGECTKEILSALKGFSNADTWTMVRGYSYNIAMNLQSDTAVLTDSEYSVDKFVYMSRSLSIYFSK